MLWKNGRSIAEALLELRRREVFCVLQVRAAQIHFCEIGPGKIRIVKAGVAQICSAEIGLIEPRVGEVRARQIRGFEICRHEAREPQARAA
jgi:hypothetical protein